MLENVELLKAYPQRSTSMIKVEKHLSKSGFSKIVSQGFIVIILGGKEDWSLQLFFSTTIFAIK